VKRISGLLGSKVRMYSLKINKKLYSLKVSKINTIHEDEEQLNKITKGKNIPINTSYLEFGIYLINFIFFILVLNKIFILLFCSYNLLTFLKW